MFLYYGMYEFHGVNDTHVERISFYNSTRCLRWKEHRYGKSHIYDKRIISKHYKTQNLFL